MVICNSQHNRVRDKTNGTHIKASDYTEISMFKIYLALALLIIHTGCVNLLVQLNYI